MSQEHFCLECPRHGRIAALLDMPGVCKECADESRRSEVTLRLARAMDSIHPERRWARLDSPLMTERLHVEGPITWALSVGGAKVIDGIGWPSLRNHADKLASYRKLTISGELSGVGKTSVAVALFNDVIDTARDRMLAWQEPPPYAESARMIAAIDLEDPATLRAALGAPFTLLDDAGQEGKCGGFRASDRLAATCDLLDRRERFSHKRTIVTTFGSREDWGNKWYHGRVTRLYWDMPNAAVLELRRSK